MDTRHAHCVLYHWHKVTTGQRSMHSERQTGTPRPEQSLAAVDAQKTWGRMPGSAHPLAVVDRPGRAQLTHGLPHRSGVVDGPRHAPVTCQAHDPNRQHQCQHPPRRRITHLRVVPHSSVPPSLPTARIARRSASWSTMPSCTQRITPSVMFTILSPPQTSRGDSWCARQLPARGGARTRLSEHAHLA